MKNNDELLTNLTGKDEAAAQSAADFMINNSDIELFKKLVEKSEYLYDFVWNNVLKRIKNAVNKDNFKNIINFFVVHSPYYDNLFAEILSKNANEDLTDEIFNLLENGTIEQKTNAAKYFKYIPDTIAIELLSKYAFSDNEQLSYNAAEALGQMQDEVSYDIALGMLKNNDEFDKIKAVRYFTAYGSKYPLDEIFEAIKTSKVAENLSGLVPYMESLLCLIAEEKTKENALVILDYILSGLGEILPLSEIFQFEIFDISEYLININKSENDFSGQIAEILLKTYSKFKLFTENQEYIFDETKETKHEIQSIFTLLKSQNEEFWSLQKKLVLSELKNSNRNRIISALLVIIEYNITDAVEKIRNIISSSDDEILICESLNALRLLKCLTKEDIAKTNGKINNPNIQAIIDNMI